MAATIGQARTDVSTRSTRSLPGASDDRCGADDRPGP